MAIKGIDREALAKRIEQREKEGDIKPKECEGNKDIVPKIQSKIIKNRFRVDENGVCGKITNITGGDGIVRKQIEIPGSYMGKEGVFQYIIEADGVSCNHRLFVPNK